MQIINSHLPNLEITQAGTAAAEELLAQVGLTWAQLIELPPTRQARIIQYLLPEPANQRNNEQAGLVELGNRLWQGQQKAEKINKSLLLALFELFLVAGQKEPAAEIFGRVYPDPVPNQVTYFERAARLCLAQGDNLGAWEAAVDLRRTFPNAMTTHYLLADLLLRMNDQAGARGCYTAALKLNPESSKALLGLAQSELAAGNSKATREIAAQLENSPRLNWRNLQQLAQIWRGLGDGVKADQLEEMAQLWGERHLTAILEGQESSEEAEVESRPVGEILEGIQVRNAQGELAPAQASQTVEVPVAARRLLQEVFGHSQFRPGQAEVIASVLAGRNTLAVLPTGGGKSLCYQLPALLLERPVLVISPLISLMKDQFDKLPPLLQAQSAIINSSLEPGEAARILREVADGSSNLRLIYVARERLRQYPFVAAMIQARLGLLVIDEAHCVTIWGNDFRPDYLFIRRALDDLTALNPDFSPTVLAVTATATPTIATEIAEQLGRPLVTVRGTMLRSNLHYRVVKASGDERDSQLIALCQELEGSGIIYVRSRQNAERVAARLQQVGITAGFYHAGLGQAARKRAQEDWNAGRSRIVAATVAFGMGIDKPDVRFIVHYNLSDSVENYVQESGRAGRDGLPSACVLFYAPGEKGNLTRFRQADNLDIEALRTIFGVVKKALRGRTIGLVSQDSLLSALNSGPAEYNNEVEVSETRLRVGLSLLERAGMLTRHYDLPLSAEISLLSTKLVEPIVSLTAAYQFEPDQSLEVGLTKLATTLNCPLTELEPKLLEWARAGYIRYRPGKREMLLELAPISKDSGASERVKNLLDTLESAQLHRVEQIADYAKQSKCRHAFLARHFGERLPAGNCGACDICVAQAASQPSKTIAKLNPVTTGATVNPVDSTSSIYYILKALAELKIGTTIGKSGLQKLLLGNESSPASFRNSASWAVLADKIKPRTLDELIGQLIEQGHITPQKVAGQYGQSFQALYLSEQGREWLEQSSPVAADITTAQAQAKGGVNLASKELALDQADALAVLQCLGQLDSGNKDGPKIGQSGLIRLLLGQQSALGTSASNPYKGALAVRFKEKEIEQLIRRLVAQGFIEQHEATHLSGRTYPALSLSADGWLRIRMEGEG